MQKGSNTREEITLQELKELLQWQKGEFMIHVAFGEEEDDSEKAKRG